MPSPGFDSDAPQDAELRAVSIPEGLIQRLRRTALADDGDLDAAIREVAIPAGLLRRLRQPALLTDEGLDAALREIPVSAQLPGRLHQVPKNWIRMTRLSQRAAAVSLLIAIGVSYFAAMIALLLSAYPYSGEISRPKSIPPSTAAISSEPGQPGSDFRVAAIPGSGEAEGVRLAGLPTPVPEVRLVDLERPRRPAPAGLSELIGGGAGADLFLDVTMHRWGILAAHRQFDELPELQLVAGLIPRGIDWPVVTGSNPHILIRYGVHPFVNPALHPRLQSSVVPLDADASSYELTRRYLEEGKLPPADVVRTEEFLAAVDYEFPRPKDQSMGLSTAAGPSPFGGPGLRLMQIGVQARQLPDKKHPPTYLILAVDVSASMRWGGRLEIVRRQLSGLVRRLGREDRLSLVIFSEDARVLAEEVGQGEADQLLAVIDLLSAEGSTNVGAGLRAAYALAQHCSVPDGTAARVVLLTDGLAEFGTATAEKIHQRLAEAADQQILLHVIDLGQEQQPDPQLADFARWGGGKVHRATNGDQVRWALREIVSGEPQLVAADARLDVTFNPKSVLEYRLLGHEAKAMAGLMPARPEADFRAGQTATALYEIRLKQGGGQEVAKVELTWRDPGQSGPHVLTRTVRRRQFGSSLSKAPLSLQEAALVARTAEVLRRSPYALSSGDSPSLGLAGVLQLAGHVDTRLYERPTFVEFVSLLEQAVKAKPHSGR